MQRLQPFAFVVGAARGLAVDGDELVPTRPQRRDPALETTPEGQGIDPIDQCAQPALAGNAVMERREPSQKIEMMFAPGDDVVEIVAGGDRGAGQQKKHLGQGIHTRQGSRVVRELGKMLQKQCQSRPRHILVREKIGRIAHPGAPCESERRTNHLPHVNAKSSLT